MPRHRRSNFLKTALRIAFICLLAATLYFPLGCAVSATGPVSSSLSKQQAALATKQIPAQFFGLVVKNAATQPAVAAGARRLWDSGVTWAALEPAQGQFNWAVLDAEVSAAEQAGAEVTLTLGMTPTWASSDPGASSGYGAGATAMPARLADWDAYVSAVAARYKGRVGAYEVWNAPEDAAYWSGNATQMGADMAALAAHAATAVHTADKAALVVSPALSPDGLRVFLAAGGGASVDAIGSSLVADGQAPESMTGTVTALRAAMAGTSAESKPLWNEQGSWTLPQGGLSDENQAGYVARALMLNAGYAVARMHWYAWDAHNAGSLQLTGSDAQPTLAGAAYGVVEGWLNGVQMNGCAGTAGGVWTCQLVRGGATEWVLWSANGTAQSSAFGAATVTDLAGHTTVIGADGSVQVGASPVLLR